MIERSPGDSQPLKEDKGPWYLRKVTVIAILLNFLILGLPFLWLSSRFSQKAKIIITIITILFTVKAVFLGKTIYSQFQQLMSSWQTVLEPATNVAPSAAL